MSNLRITPNCLAGQTIVLTGKVLGVGRGDMFRTIIQAGGSAADKIDASTTLLVVAGASGASQTTKFKAAVKRGLPIISDGSFRDVLEGRITVRAAAMASTMSGGSSPSPPKAARTASPKNNKRELRQRAAAAKQLDQLAASEITGPYAIGF